MAATKGIVSGGNYTFSAAAKTITFSSDYLGMSLSDITYITNIKSGVATVIYDPFDATKGGTLSGLTLTLAYDTTAMADTDPLQIIVGFTPVNADPLPVKIVEGPDEKDDTALLQNISDNLDYLNLALDQAEGIQVNVRDVVTKKDVQGANIPSDAPSPIHFSLRPTINDCFTFDTTGYQSLSVILNLTSWSAGIVWEGSNDNANWGSIPYTYQQANTTLGSPAITSAPISLNAPYTMTISCITRFIRIRATSTGVSNPVAQGVAYLRQIPIPALTQLTTMPCNVSNTVATNISQINSTTPNANTQNAQNSTQASTGGIGVAGHYVQTSNLPNAASTLQTLVPFPIGIGGREQPYIGALSGIFRYITVDGGGRYILGGDTPDTETRFQSKLASGAIPGIPPRGVGGRPNTMHGSQALLVEDVGQSEGDTTGTLLQQILVELKMLNQQINELPFTLNQGLHMQNEVAEYRTEEYNNHVNNQ